VSYTARTNNRGGNITSTTQVTRKLDGKLVGEFLRPHARKHAYTDKQPENMMLPAPSAEKAEAYQKAQLSLRDRAMLPVS